MTAAKKLAARVVRPAARRQASNRDLQPVTPKPALEVQERLLSNLARFLLASGFTQDTCLKVFEKALENAGQARTGQSKVAPGMGATDAAHLISHWYTCPDYLDGSGQPLSLPFAGKQRSFSGLVTEVIPEITPRAALAFLLNLKAISQRGGKLRPVSRKQIVDSAQPYFAARALELVDGLLSTLVRNQTASTPKERYFEAAATNHRFPVTAIKPFRHRLASRADELLKDLDSDMTRLERRAKPGVPTVRLASCVFLYESGGRKGER